MKKTIVFLISLVAVLCLAQAGMAQPVAVIESPVHRFATVPDGVRVDHDFVVKNTGDSDLYIENVLPP